MKEIGNHKRWFDWIDTFGNFIKNQRDISDNLKKRLLKAVIDFIVVDYDTIEKVHRLKVQFKIPVFQKVKEKNDKNRVFDSFKSLIKSIDQNSPVHNYSTVIESFPTLLDRNSVSQGYSLRFSLELTSANLWLPPYSTYQQELFDLISKLHDEDGLNFKQISDWLNDHHYLTPRGHTFMQKHVWSIYQKKNRSIKRFSREFKDVISDMKIDVVDYVPVTN